MKKPTLLTHNNFKKALMRRPLFRKAHAELDFEFQILEALIRARMEKKLTQSELAKKIGVAQSALARFESGRTNPTLSFLQKITHGLGLKITVK